MSMQDKVLAQLASVALWENRPWRRLRRGRSAVIDAAVARMRQELRELEMAVVLLEETRTAWVICAGPADDPRYLAMQCGERVFRRNLRTALQFRRRDDAVAAMQLLDRPPSARVEGIPLRRGDL
ncbi:MAG: hypothetical protein AAFW69_04255 [Pseudomonadota bacterium]